MVLNVSPRKLANQQHWLHGVLHRSGSPVQGDWACYNLLSRNPGTIRKTWAVQPPSSLWVGREESLLSQHAGMVRKRRIPDGNGWSAESSEEVSSGLR